MHSVLRSLPAWLCVFLAPSAAAQLTIVTNLPGTFVDISGTGTPLNLADDGEVDIPTTIGNALLVAGTARVGSNGAVRFGGPGTELAFTNAVIPSSGAFGLTSQVVIPFWDDVNTVGGTVGNIYWQEVGGTFIVQWQDVGFFGTPSTERATFQLQVHASGPALAQFIYLDIMQMRPNGGGSATIGYQAGGFGNDVQFSFDTPGAVADGSVLSLTSTVIVPPPVVGVDLRNGGRYFTSTADANFVTNFVSPAPTGAVTLFAIDFDASAMTLWGVNNANSEYGTINPATGTFTPLGVIAGVPALSTTGLTAASDGTTWYLSTIIGGVSTLFAGDITTGSFFNVGPMTGAGSVIDISMSSAGRLIAHDITTDFFFDIDPVTAVATPIGPSGVPANFAQGMDFDWSTDTLYATIYTGGGAGQFCTVDLTTGAVTSLVDTTPLNAEMEMAVQVAAPGPGYVQAGSDFYTTPGTGDTVKDFSSLPLAAGFFGVGSDPFTGTIVFRGEPLNGTGLAGGVDTIVERLGPADLANIGDVADVAIKIKALSLVSVQPIDVTFNGMTSTSRYDVRGTLATDLMLQTAGNLRLTRTHQDGGSFQSILAVTPKLVFTKVSGANGDNNAMMDPAAAIFFQSSVSPSPCWSFNDGGFNLTSSPGGLVDHDGNPMTPNVAFPATTINFHSGVCPPVGPCPATLKLTIEQTLRERHGLMAASLGLKLGVNYCQTTPNSTGCDGRISGLGSTVVVANNFTLQSRVMPQNAFGFFLTSMTQGFVANPGGSQGNLCLGGSIGRYVGPGQIQNSGATGQITLFVDLTQHPTPTGPVAVMPGDTWNFQCWFRDSVGGGSTSNFTDGLQVLFQ